MATFWIEGLPKVEEREGLFFLTFTSGSEDFAFAMRPVTAGGFGASLVQDVQRLFSERTANVERFAPKPKRKPKRPA